jgi:hypothetical protein
MCQNLQKDKVLKNQVGSFGKGNEYKPIKMFVDVVPCLCGKWYATVKGGQYVQCEPETWKEAK